MAWDASSVDQSFRNITAGLFGLYPPYSGLLDTNGQWTTDVTRPGHEIGARCARSGNWFPGEGLTTDERGRRVGRQFWTSGLEVPIIPPFPAFVTEYEEDD
jgi:hypothetical protein